MAPAFSFLRKKTLELFYKLFYMEKSILAGALTTAILTNVINNDMFTKIMRILGIWQYN